MMIIGMDFGTTNSGMAIYDGQHIKLIPLNTSGGGIDRTALYITNDRQVYIGRRAIDTYYAQNLNRPVQIAKVRVGEIRLTFAELPTFVRDVYIDKDLLSPGRLFVSFKTGLSSLNYIGTVVGEHFYFLEDIIGLYLYVARQQAEKALQTPLTRIVLGRPVRFSTDPEANTLAKERLLKAAFRAGYEEVYLQYEPIAAAHHYETTLDHPQNVLIFDFGGGTLDISILRLGNGTPQTVLANGGLPIAGDVFDQKLVRAKLPRHFGEGTQYRSGNQWLPVPSSYYEAFLSWQDMLSLQRPEMLEEIRRIEQTAEHPMLIRALRGLVASSYGLKMFDIVEGTKRELSSSTHSMVRLDGPDFKVRQIVTRSEFERVIRPEVRQIDAYLDEMLTMAGLNAQQIDVVVRTGGSSQIPAFVQLLETKFGGGKVRNLDTFSSVTSGLGIIAHKLERGNLGLPAYYARDYVSRDVVQAGTAQGIPAVDFAMMQKFIALGQADDTVPTDALIGLTDSGEIVAAPTPLTEPLPPHLSAVFSAPSNQPVILMTTEYRLLLRTPQQIHRLHTLGLTLSNAEGFQNDIFGDEHVCTIADWQQVRGAAAPMLVSKSGYFKTYTPTLLPRLEQPVRYTFDRLKGQPLGLVDAAGEILAFSTSGRVVRINTEAQGQTSGRLMIMNGEELLLGVYPLQQPATFLLANAEGFVILVESAAIPLAPALGTSGHKIFTRRQLQAVTPWHAGQSIYVITSQRMFSLDHALVEAGKKQKLKTGERLIGLVHLDTPRSIPTESA